MIHNIYSINLIPYLMHCFLWTNKQKGQIGTASENTLMIIQFHPKIYQFKDDKTRQSHELQSPGDPEWLDSSYEIKRSIKKKKKKHLKYFYSKGVSSILFAYFLKRAQKTEA